MSSQGRIIMSKVNCVALKSHPLNWKSGTLIFLDFLFLWFGYLSLSPFSIRTVLDVWGMGRFGSGGGGLMIDVQLKLLHIHLVKGETCYKFAAHSSAESRNWLFSICIS